MLRASFPDAKTLYSLIEAIAETTDEALFKFTQEGLKITAMDPAKMK